MKTEKQLEQLRENFKQGKVEAIETGDYGAAEKFGLMIGMLEWILSDTSTTSADKLAEQPLENARESWKRRN